ncbi:probable F420-dependent oxidoreductase, MSMEG_4141 family [Actinomadura meyerae]|uniref:Probable F420-dependent oxidoreductase, MSMEG_4141 family n=1 Tax=Actinomadura meyerae TaxID=240840 RepID=A0A239LWA5_9ACTN|nr:LLM class F420-dependent oxidoreductase [Actinomadura meyerae]SNT33904.1 probable F420-dependent oxidoreductase, MSMEG_4141 family [Actinomadura meyerae]
MDKIELGRLGIWRPWSALDPELARDLEDLGYGAIWIGGSPRGDLKIAERLLAGTDRIVIATGIVNMWATPATEAAASYHRLHDAYGGRFLLGVGIGHPEATQEYRSPYETIVRYLDDLDAADVPAAGRVLAALGPRVLRLAAERTAGAHPYFTTPEHTRQARETLGAGPLLVPEQKVVLDTDEERARATAREAAKMYLGLRNYVGNFKRLGFTDADVAGGGSDALIDALVAQGDAAALAARVREHLDAGADQVAVQVLGDGDPRPALRGIAEALG